MLDGVAKIESEFNGQVAFDALGRADFCHCWTDNLISTDIITVFIGKVFQNTASSLTCFKRAFHFVTNDFIPRHVVTNFVTVHKERCEVFLHAVSLPVSKAHNLNRLTVTTRTRISYRDAGTVILEGVTVECLNFLVIGFGKVIGLHGVKRLKRPCF